jgi:hypothetical protein
MLAVRTARFCFGRSVVAHAQVLTTFFGRVRRRREKKVLSTSRSRMHVRLDEV